MDNMNDMLFDSCFRLPGKDFRFALKLTNKYSKKSEIIEIDKDDLYDIIKNYEPHQDGEYIDLISNNRLTSISKKSEYPYDKVGIEYKIIRKYIWNKVKYNDPRVFILDIETRSDNFVPDVTKVKFPVTTIQIYDSYSNTTFIFGSKEYNNTYDLSDKELNDKVIYSYCKTEELLFKRFFALIDKLKPSLVIGHFAESFDYPYLFNRAKILNLDTNKFSPHGTAKLKAFNNSRGSLSYTIEGTGIFYMDSIDIYKKLILKPRKSYALDSLGEIHCNENKIQYKQFFKTIDDFYQGNLSVSEYKLSEEDKNSELYKAYLEKDEDKIRKISYDLFVKYAARDVQLLYRILDKLQLIQLMKNMSEKMGIMIKDSLGTTKPWSVYLSNIAFNENKLIKQQDNSDADTYYAGGFVKDPIKGKSKWIFSLDINSMYPNIIIAYNMSPETYVQPSDVPKELREFANKYFYSDDENIVLKYINTDDGKKILKQYALLLRKYNLTGTIHGVFFRKDKQGILPQLVQGIYNERVQAKSDIKKYKELKKNIIYIKADGEYNIENYIDLKNIKQIKDIPEKLKDRVLNFIDEKIAELDLEQGTLKVLINSVYGALGNQWFSLYNKDIASSVTAQGRFFIKYMAKKGCENIAKYYNVPFSYKYWVYTDTDSAYFTLQDFIKTDDVKGIEKVYEFEKNTEKIVQDAVNGTNLIFNLFDKSVIAAKREIIAISGIFTAKKAYLLAVLDDEGDKYFEKPKIKYTGIELAKSALGDFSREVVQGAVNPLLFGTEKELREYLSKMKKKFKKAAPDSIARTIAVKALDEYSYNKNLTKYISKFKNKNGGLKSAPGHVAAALLYNHIVSENKLNYDLIVEGDIIKQLYIKNYSINIQGTKFNAKAIGYIDEFFIKENFIKYIDYDTMWDKNVIKPISTLANHLDWKNLDIEQELILDAW